MEIESQIIIGKVNHKGQELDCYIPQVKFGDKWCNILSQGSYILKDSFDPVMLCKVCHGDGCKECRNGFRKGVSVDLKHIAQSFIDREIEKINEATILTNNLLKKYVE